ncbi:aromatic amino acid lyase, partial [Dolichospermum sp. ST_sed1]|nr:aromatic amino acid lyase [Dolichospermum sp. ST_sed1]
MPFLLGENTLTCEQLVQLAVKPNPTLAISSEVRAKLKMFRGYVEKVLQSDKTVYGINTGFGFLSDVSIPKDKLVQLQLNLIRSHACGVGETVEPEVIRGLLILRAHTFLLGHSAVSESCIDTILEFLKHDILPIIPCKGSVGASGDLAPLSHLALGLLGEGDVFYQGIKMPAAAALKKSGVKAFSPSAKEGLSLINGTQFMTTIGAFAIVEAKKLSNAADAIAALSLDAIRGTLSAFDERIQNVRKQNGQKKVAEHIRKLFSGKDEIMSSHADCNKVQDPYSF